MKKLYLQKLVLASLAVLPLFAHAQEWRQEGRAIFYRQRGEHQWHRAPGAALSVGDGWVIGTDRVEGGYGIYRWNGRNWDRAPGAGVRIGGSYSSPWVVNDRGERFGWNGYDWRQEGGYRDRDDRGRNERFIPAPRRDERRDDHRDRDDRRDSHRDIDDDDRDDRRH